MRIVHVINSLGTGGAETLVVELALAMEARGHEVEIATIGRQQGIPFHRALAYGLKVTQVGGSAYDPTSILKLRKALKGADVVHAHLFPSLYFTPLAASGIPLVYTEHSTWNRRRDQKLFRWADRLFYSKFGMLVAISTGVRDSLTHYLASLKVNSAVALVQNGIADRFFEQGTRRARELGTEFRLIAVGTLDDRKNFGDAIRAVATSPGSTLTIVGDGPQRDRLRALIESEGASDRISLLGLREDVIRLMSEHDALISTSRFEGFSLVAAEAMTLGLPVVGPDVPGFRDSVLHDVSGLLFDQNEGVSSIVDGLNRLRTEEGLYGKLSRGAIEHSERFRMDRTASAYLGTYAELVATTAERTPPE